MKIDKKAYEAAGFLEKFNIKKFFSRLNIHLDKWISKLKGGNNG
jgi:hypothetical protein